MADEHTPGEQHDAEPLNKVTEQSYYRDHNGDYPAGGGELASDGPVHDEVANIAVVPGSVAADGVFAGTVDASTWDQPVVDEGAVNEPPKSRHSKGSDESDA